MRPPSQPPRTITRAVRHAFALCVLTTLTLGCGEGEFELEGYDASAGWDEVASLEGQLVTRLQPKADAFVRAGSWASHSFGSALDLSIKHGSTEFYREVFVRFDLSALAGKKPTRALLRLNVTDAHNGFPITVKAAAVRNATWTESITYATRPTAQVGPILTAPPIRALGMVAIDLTPLVTSELNAGTKQLTLRLYSDAGENRIVTFGSRESASAPRLEVTTEDAATAPPPTTPSTWFSTTLNPAASTSGWSLETSGSMEKITVRNGRAECVAGGYSAGTHYARLRRKLPETDDFAPSRSFTIKADFELPSNFYTQHQSYLRFFNTDNYPATLKTSKKTVGASNSNEWRVGFLVYNGDKLPRLMSEHQNMGALTLWTGKNPLPAGRHVVEVRFTPSRTNTGSWELFINGTRMGGAQGVQTVPSTVTASEMVVTRVVGGIDGAAAQSTKAVQVNLYSLAFSAER